jgi:hypothetical protein
MKEKIMAIFAKLGLVEKAAKKEMTQEDWTAVQTAFKEEYKIDLTAASEELGKPNPLEQAHQEAIAALFSATADAPDGKKPVEKPEEKQDVNIAAEIKKIQLELKATKEENMKLGQKMETFNPVILDPKRPKVVNAAFGHGDRSKYLFGIEHKMYSREKWWNELAATGKNIEGLTQDHEEDLKTEVKNFGLSLAARYRELKDTNLLNNLPDLLAAGELSYTNFADTGWGEEYVQRRQDAIIAYIRTKPSVTRIFPLHSNVQHKEILTNAFFAEMTQAFQNSETVWKGTYSFEPLEAQVHDVMLEFKLSWLKDMESQYIGYLNREGSSPMKWSMIEWLNVRILEVAVNEQEMRRINGWRVEPTEGTAGDYMFAANGYLRMLQSYEDNFYVLPFEDLMLYTSSTMLTYVDSFLSKVNLLLDSLNGYSLLINEKHKPWYKKLYRAAYGTDMDFDGITTKVMDYDISGIVWVPNMPSNAYKMALVQLGNIECLENRPGEMLALYLERRMKTLYAGSYWKEGVGASMAGKKYATKAAAVTAARQYQYIYTNYPVAELAADSTSASALESHMFQTVANSGATAIVDITSKTEHQWYKIICGSATNATTIAKSDLFSNLTAAWVPTAVGDYLVVYWNATTSKFVEIERRVTS